MITLEEHNRILAEIVEVCAVKCEEQAKIFGSTEYSTGQPFSSLAERFACAQCANSIRLINNGNTND